jgi:hypothetical protein
VVRLDLPAACDADLAEERLVASHADGTNTPWLMAETDCYLSYTIGHSWLVGVDVADVADAIDEYGPQRLTSSRA